MTIAALAAVTNRIIERSQPKRQAYLDRLQAAAESGPHRSALSCTNLVHGFAACSAADKDALSGDVVPNLAIITSYNDMLSARVAGLTNASQLILLSNIDGLLTPDSNEVIADVENVEDVLSFIRSDKGKFSIGGMASKLQAVQVALDAGIQTVIAHGKRPDRLPDVIQGAGLCTRFHP